MYRSLKRLLLERLPLSHPLITCDFQTHKSLEFYFQTALHFLENYISNLLVISMEVKYCSSFAAIYQFGEIKKY